MTTQAVPTRHTVAFTDTSLRVDLEWFAAHPEASWYLRPALDGEHPELTSRDILRVYRGTNGQRRRTVWKRGEA